MKKWKEFFIFYFSVSAVLLPIAVFSLPASFRCSYDPPNDDDVIHGVVVGSGHRTRHHKRDIFRPMKFHITYDKSVDSLGTDIRDYVVNKLVKDSVDYWQSVLSVRPSGGSLLLNRKCISGKYYRMPVDGIQRYVCAGSGCANVTMCGESEVPNDHLTSCFVSNGQTAALQTERSGNGVQADFLLYIAAVNTEKCLKNADTIAYAAHCQLESILDRPIAGHMNLCPKSLRMDLRHQELLISTIKHEMVHALGFSASLFGYFRTPDGVPLTERGEDGKPKRNIFGPYNASELTLKNVTIDNWWTRSGFQKRSTTYLVTPAVKEAARLHFGCDKLPGAELENQGYEGTALTHFEKRLFENEAMTGVHTQSPSYSNLTLALLYDTGWYRVDFSKAELLRWGHKLGCDFALKSCGEWIKNRRLKGLPVDPFCDEVKTSNGTTTRCTSSRDSVALCNLVQYDREIPLLYQNFDRIDKVDDSKTSYYGGSVELADYCPFPQEFDWKDKSGIASRDSRCEIPNNSPIGIDNAALEETGENSACFYHGTKQWDLKRCLQRRTYSHYGAGCYTYFCREGRLWISLLNYTKPYPCYKTGQYVPIGLVNGGWLHEGSIICPACEELCSANSCLPEKDPPVLVGDFGSSIPCRANKICCIYLFSFLLLLGLFCIY